MIQLGYIGLFLIGVSPITLSLIVPEFFPETAKIKVNFLNVVLDSQSLWPRGLCVDLVAAVKSRTAKIKKIDEKADATLARKLG